MARKKVKIEESIDLALPVKHCVCGNTPIWVYFISSDDSEKQYMFYCSNSECSYFRVTDPRTDFVDAMNRWNELIDGRCG